MKKFLAVLILTVSVAGGLYAQQAAVTSMETRKPRESAAGAYDTTMKGSFDDNLKKFGWGLLMYVPNRVCDVLDLLTLKIGVGPKLGLGFQVTEYFQLKGEAGESGFFCIDYDRQWGGGVYNGFSYGFLCFERDNFGIYEPLGWQRGYELLDHKLRIPALSEERYASRKIDPWAIGANFAMGIDIGVYFHPTAVADLLLGILMVDLDNDDF